MKMRLRAVAVHCVNVSHEEGHVRSTALAAVQTLAKGLTARQYSAVPDPDFVIVTGSPGSGKTTIGHRSQTG